MSTKVQNEELPTRWEIELEFVQSLSNIDYLNYLSHKKYFEDPRFQYYLKYLYNYWKRSENLKYLIYPNCMEILRLLIANDNFKVEVVKQEFRDLVINDMVENWKAEKSVDIKNANSVNTDNTNHPESTDSIGDTEKNSIPQEDIQKEGNGKIYQMGESEDTKTDEKALEVQNREKGILRNEDKESKAQEKTNEITDHGKATVTEQKKINEIKDEEEDSVMS